MNNLKEKLKQDITKLLIEYEDSTNESIGCFISFQNDNCYQGFDDFEYVGEKFSSMLKYGWYINKFRIPNEIVKGEE